MNQTDENRLQELLREHDRSAIVALAQSLYDRAKKRLASGEGTTQREVAILNNARSVLQRERSNPTQE
jgi:hypothetical protein